LGDTSLNVEKECITREGSRGEDMERLAYIELYQTFKQFY